MGGWVGQSYAVIFATAHFRATVFFAPVKSLTNRQILQVVGIFSETSVNILT